MTSRVLIFSLLLFSGAAWLPAKIIGSNTPSLPITAGRIAALPAGEQAGWRAYLDRSDRQRAADQAFLMAELKSLGMTDALVPSEGHNARTVPLDEAAGWYGRAEARRIADIVVSFQIPSGGWSKNLDLSKAPRRPGEHFAPNNVSRHLEADDYDRPHDLHWSYVGTFDNDATITELRFLAKVITATDPAQGAAYRTAFLHGLEYIFASQYPTGGWPQVWPLEGSYHDNITYNDDAMVHVVSLLRDIAGGQAEYAFVPAEARTRAAAAVERGVQCILATQIVVAGHPTVWCQQHDPITLVPASARNYEMPSACSSESDDIMIFLMELPKPSPEVVAAIHAAAAWFEQTAINGFAYRRTSQEGRKLVPEPGAGPLWARYYEIGTNRPIFGDRDKSIHDRVEELSAERRNGYRWYDDGAHQALAMYERWRMVHPTEP